MHWPAPEGTGRTTGHEPTANAGEPPTITLGYTLNWPYVGNFWWPLSRALPRLVPHDWVVERLGWMTTETRHAWDAGEVRELLLQGRRVPVYQAVSASRSTAKGLQVALASSGAPCQLAVLGVGEVFRVTRCLREENKIARSGGIHANGRRFPVTVARLAASLGPIGLN